MPLHFDLLNNLHHPLSPHCLIHHDAVDYCCRSDDDASAARNAYHRDRYSRDDSVRTFATVTSPQAERFLRHSRQLHSHIGNLISRQSWSATLVRWMMTESSRGSKILTSVASLSNAKRQCSCSSHWLAHLSGDDTCTDSLDSCRDMVRQLHSILCLISSIPWNLAASLYSCSPTMLCWSSLSSSDGDLSWRRSRVDSQAMEKFLYLLERVERWED